ncbi:MAG: pilus assembly protein, partial [Candidatus Dormibacteraeota bacterium]|nr:pilus assembly protein [Candidatus Dormibacteraeota bacterium]
MADSRGQALVEFSMTIGVFLLLLVGAFAASVYTVERSAAVTAVAA